MAGGVLTFPLSNEIMKNWAFEMYMFQSLLLLFRGFKEKKAVNL